MKAFFTLWKREVASYFLTPTAYIITPIFLVVMGFGFCWYVEANLMQGTSIYDVLRAVYGSLGWLGIFMSIPLLTMRCFAEERKSGTIESLMTAPVSDVTIVLAKFLGVVFVYLIMWSPTLVYVHLLNTLNDASYQVDLGALLAIFIGGGSISLFLLAVGVLSSSLTRNVIVSAIVTFAFITTFFLLGLLTESRSDAVAELAKRFSGVYHLLEFARGVVDTRPLVFYWSSTVLVLYSTVRVLDARRWKA